MSLQNYVVASPWLGVVTIILANAIVRPAVLECLSRGWIGDGHAWIICVLTELFTLLGITWIRVEAFYQDARGRPSMRLLPEPELEKASLKVIEQDRFISIWSFGLVSTFLLSIALYSHAFKLPNNDGASLTTEHVAWICLFPAVIMGVISGVALPDNDRHRSFAFWPCVLGFVGRWGILVSVNVRIMSLLACAGICETVAGILQPRMKMPEISRIEIAAHEDPEPPPPPL